MRPKKLKSLAFPYPLQEAGFSSYRPVLGEGVFMTEEKRREEKRFSSKSKEGLDERRWRGI